MHFTTQTLHLGKEVGALVSKLFASSDWKHYDQPDEAELRRFPTNARQMLQVGSAILDPFLGEHFFR